jgi:hypothetical protein
VLRATHAHDLERLAEAESRLKDELAAKAARDAKAEEEAEEAAAEKALQARQLAAAITIQAAWRGFKVRQQMPSVWNVTISLTQACEVFQMRLCVVSFGETACL